MNESVILIRGRRQSVANNLPNRRYPARKDHGEWLVLNSWYCPWRDREARFSVTATRSSADVHPEPELRCCRPALSMFRLARSVAGSHDHRIGHDESNVRQSILANGWQTSSTVSWSSNTGTATIVVNQPTQAKGNIVPPPTQRFFRAFPN